MSYETRKRTLRSFANEERLIKKSKSEECLNAIQFLKLSREISYNIYKSIIMYLNKETHYEICCSKFDKYFCINMFILKYFTPKWYYRELTYVVFNYDLTIRNPIMLNNFKPTLLFSRSMFKKISNLFDLFTGHLDEFESFVKSISILWSLLFGYKIYNHIKTYNVRVFCNDILHESGLLFLNTTPPISTRNHFYEDVDIDNSITDFISKLVEIIQNVNKKQRFIHVRILFESGLPENTIKEIFGWNKMFRYVFLFDNNRYIFLTILNHFVYWDEEKVPNIIRLKVCHYDIIKKNLDDVSNTFPNKHRRYNYTDVGYTHLYYPFDHEDQNDNIYDDNLEGYIQLVSSLYVLEHYNKNNSHTIIVTNESYYSAYDSE